MSTNRSFAPTTTPAFADNRTSMAPLPSEWNDTILVFKILEGIIIALTLWILLCMILYGFKTKRWTNNPGNSGFTNGALYTTCVVAIALTLPKLVLTEFLLFLSLAPPKSIPCETLFDLTTSTFFISLYVMYLFLWILQRKIYHHPYVKCSVNRHANNFSRAVILILTGGTVLIVTALFADRDNYELHELYGCVLREEKAESIFNLATIFMVCALVTQLVMLTLSMYAASLSITLRPTELNGEPATVTQSNVEPAAVQDKQQNESQTCCQLFIGNISGSVAKYDAISPLQMLVKRMAISSIIIIGTDVVTGLIVTFGIPENSPTIIHSIPDDISSFVNVCAMLAIFGFAGQVVTILCPKAVKRVRSRRHTRKRVDGELANQFQGVETK